MSEAGTTPGPRLYAPPWSEREARLHSMEFADGWQYATVWRFADSSQPWITLGPPTGDGWEINSHYQHGVKRTITPRWSDGSVVMQLTPWRRRVEGMRPGDPGQTIHERVKWGGDPRP